MLEYNEIKPKKFIVFEGEPYEVLDAHVFRKQQRKPVNATKMKNLFTGRVMEHSFHQSDKAEEAEIETIKVKYLYTHRDEYWFCEEKDASKRFALSRDQVGESIKFVKPNSVVDLLSFQGKMLELSLPIKVELKVKTAPPAVKGDTVTGGNKQIILETGAAINAPMFIKEGDVVRINTETGAYVERV